MGFPLLPRNFSLFLAMGSHVAALFLLLVYFSGGVYSLSVDVAHHFLLADFLSQSTGENIHTLPSMAPMADYPNASHWLSVFLGKILGSNYLSITVISLLSVYLLYFLCYDFVIKNFGIVAFFSLAFFFFILSGTRSTFGHEVIGNFFYSQIIASIFFFAFVYIASSEHISDIGVYLIGYIFTISSAYFHILPSIEVISTTVLFGLIGFVLPSWRTASRNKHLIRLTVFAVCSVVSLYFHPSFQKMRMLSGNDGALEFRVPLIALFLMACTVAAWQIAAIYNSKDLRERADLVLASALVGSLSVAALQYLATLGGEGSNYAVKKHFFVVVPLAIMSLARLSSTITHLRYQPTISVPATVASALTVIWVYPTQPMMPLASVISPLRYAQHVAEFELPFPADGRIAFLARSVDPVTRYMISLAVFRVPFAGPGLEILRSEENVTSFDFAVVDTNSVDLSTCVDHLSANKQYVVVPSSCLANMNAGVLRHDSSNSGLFSRGWSAPEQSHRWSEGTESVLQIPLTPASIGKCALIDGFTFGQQTISVSAGGAEIFSQDFDGDAQIVVPVGQVSNKLAVTLQYSNPSSPSTDPRLLAFALRSIRVSDCP